MELNLELIEVIKELDQYNEIAEENNLKSENGQYIPPKIVNDNVFKSLTVLNKVYEMEPILEVRHLHYEYVDFLKAEDYVGCQRVVDKLKKIIKRNED